MRLLLFAAALAPSGALAQSGPSAADFANLREDVRGLAQQVNDLSLRVEVLERDNGRLRAAASTGDRNYATLEQLNAAVADLNRTIQSEVAAAKQATLDRVGEQMAKLARQVNTALDSAQPKAPPPASAPAGAAPFPQTGISYTVHKGETLAQIARKTGAKIQDIVNANKISDPGRIQAGQVLFVPGGK